MNRKLLLAGLAAMTIVSSAYAMPAFARQTGMDCAACHFQHFPALNAMGRSFKSSGYTMINKDTVVGANLSIPAVLNAGITTKIRYQKANGDGTITNNDNKSDGQLQFPDEALLQLAGRIGENIGFIIDLNIRNGGDSILESAKIPFIYDMSGIKVGLIPFTTAGQGVAYGFELLNTGAVRGQRIIEARKTFSAQQYINTGSMAEGVALVANNSLFFMNITKWSPRSVDSSTEGSPEATYIRAAITPQVGKWDLGAGVQFWTGSATRDSATAGIGENIDTKAWAIDAQAQGIVGTLPLGVYFSYASADASDATTTNIFNSGTNDDKTAAALSAELGVIPGKATVTLGYRLADNGKATNNTDNGLLLGATYQVAQTVQLQINHEIYSGNAYDGSPAGGDQLTTLMLFAAF